MLVKPRNHTVPREPQRSLRAQRPWEPVTQSRDGGISRGVRRGGTGDTRGHVAGVPRPERDEGVREAHGTRQVLATPAQRGWPGGVGDEDGEPAAPRARCRQPSASSCLKGSRHEVSADSSSLVTLLLVSFLCCPGTGRGLLGQPGWGPRTGPGPFRAGVMTSQTEPRPSLQESHSP